MKNIFLFDRIYFPSSFFFPFSKTHHHHRALHITYNVESIYIQDNRKDKGRLFESNRKDNLGGNRKGNQNPTINRVDNRVDNWEDNHKECGEIIGKEF